MHWNTYNPIYIGEFDSFTRSDVFGAGAFQIKYTIYKKNYVGPIKSLLCSGQPLVQRYLDDDPIAPVKGSEVEIKFLNKDKQTPLSLFYSEEDDTFKIKVERIAYPANKVLFEGYLVQEDCSEILVDHTHELSLVFTDNLGLLKNVPLDQGARLVAKTEYYWRHYVNTVTQMTGYFEMLPNIDPGNDPVIGDTMILEYDGGDTIYRIVDAKLVGSGLGARVRVYVDLTLPNVGSGTIWESVFFITPHDIQQRIKLGDLLKICLQNTGLLLNANFGSYAQVKLASAVFTSRLPDNIYIDCKTFKSGDNYDTLYEILEKILSRFTSTLFQCAGVWKMHRWLELPIVGNGFYQAKIYNPYFVFQFTANSAWPMQYGFGNDIETGAIETIVRPLKFVQHTFNFEQPTDMLFNYKLDYLGELLRTFTEVIGSETFTVKEYFAPGWQDNRPFKPLPNNTTPNIFRDRFIRVVYDSIGNEVDRYIWIQYLPGRTFSVAGSSKIEVNKGDKIKLSYQWKINYSVSGTSYRRATPFFFYGGSGAIYTYDFYNRVWTIGSPPGYEHFYQIELVDVQAYEYNSFDFPETMPLPEDGLLYVYLPAESDFMVSSIDFKYTPFVAGQLDVKRQQHTTTMQGTIKNNIEEEVMLDDTVKNYAKGTLFLPTFTNLVQDKTANWQDGVISRQMKLGEIVTRQLNLWRYMQRSKIELNLWPLKKFENMLGMDTVINYQLKPGFFYIFGKLEIDYKANQANGTIYEIFNPVDAETAVDGVDRLSKLSYQFQYLFK